MKTNPRTRDAARLNRSLRRLAAAGDALGVPVPRELADGPAVPLSSVQRAALNRWAGSLAVAAAVAAADAVAASLFLRRARAARGPQGEA